MPNNYYNWLDYISGLDLAGYKDFIGGPQYANFVNSARQFSADNKIARITGIPMAKTLSVPTQTGITPVYSKTGPNFLQKLKLAGSNIDMNQVNGIVSGISGFADIIGDAVETGKGEFSREDLENWNKEQNNSLSFFNKAAGNSNTTSDLLRLTNMEPDFQDAANDIKTSTYNFGKTISSAGKGALAGASIGSVIPVVGTAVGAIGGAIIGGVSDLFGQGFGIFGDKNRKNDALNRVSMLDNMVSASKINAGNRVSTNTYRQGMANYLNNAAMGGPLFTHGSDFTDDLIRIDAGGTHEQNPLGGVPAGVDPQGIPNLVEEGEIIWDDYVFSDRLKMPKSLMKKYKLGGRKGKAISFAEGVDKISEKLGTELRPNDYITQNTKDEILSEFEGVQEEKRLAQQKRNLIKAMSEMTPEEFQAMMVQPLEQQQGVMPPQGGYEMPAQVMAAQAQEEPVGLEAPGMMALGGHLFAEGGKESFPWDPIYDSEYLKKLYREGKITYNTKAGIFFDKRGKQISPQEVTRWRDTEHQQAVSRAERAAKKVNKMREWGYDVTTEAPEKEVRTISTSTTEQKPKEVTANKSTTALLKERQGTSKESGTPKVYTAKTSYNKQTPTSTPKSTVEQMRQVLEGDADFVGPILNNKQRKQDTTPAKSTRRETRPDNSIFTSDWNEFYNILRNYSPSRTAGGVSGTYAIDRQFPYGNFNTIEDLENSKEYQDFTKYVLNHGDDADVQNYLRELDKGTAEGVDKLFDGDNLKERWKDLYEKRRTDHKGGIYHFSRMAPDGTVSISNEGPLQTPAGELSKDKARVLTEDGLKGISAITDNPNNNIGLSKGNINTDILPTWMRYAPIIGGGISVISDLFNRPDYSGYNRLIADAERAGRPVSIPVTTIGNKIRRNPFDERLAVNQANQNFLAAVRGTLDTSGGNRAYRQFATSQLARDNQAAKSEIARNAYLANRQDAFQTADFNRQTDLYNMNAINQRNLTEAQLNSGRQYQGFMARANALNALENARRYDDSLVSADFTNLMQSLGNLGRENFEFNRLNAMAREGYYPIMYDGKTGDMTFVPYSGVKVANGGKVKTKKKRRF